MGIGDSSSGCATADKASLRRSHCKSVALPCRYCWPETLTSACSPAHSLRFQRRGDDSAARHPVRSTTQGRRW